MLDRAGRSNESSLSASFGPSVSGDPLEIDIVLVLVLIAACHFMHLRTKKKADAVRRQHVREREEQQFL